MQNSNGEELSSRGKTLNHESLLIFFRLGDSKFGIRGGDVREVVNDTELTPVPRAPAFIAGALNVRGTIITVLDLALLLNLPPFPVDQNSKVLFLEDNYVDIGLLVQSLEEAKRLPPGFFEASFSVTPENESKDKFIEGSFGIGTTENTDILNVASILQFVNESSFI